MSSAKVEKAVRHYQRDIEIPGQHHTRVLHCIDKLCQLPVTVQHLQDTGVGRTVNALRKGDGEVACAARALVSKWKKMVADEEDAAQEYQENGENGDQEEEEEDDAEEKEDVEEVEEKEPTPEPEPVPVYVEKWEREREKYSNSNKDDKERHRHEKHRKERSESREESHHKNKKHKKRKHEESNHYEHTKRHKVRDDDDDDDSDHNGRQSPIKSDHSPIETVHSESEFQTHEPNLSEDSDVEEVKLVVDQKPVVEKHSHSSSKESSRSHSKHHSNSSSKSSSSRREEKKSSHKREDKSDSHTHKHSKDQHKDHKHKHSSERESNHHSQTEREDKKKSKHHDEKHREKKKERSEEVQSRSEDKNKERSKKEKSSKEHRLKEETRKSSSSSKSNSATSEPKPAKNIQVTEDGIDCGSGASFAEALGMMEPTKYSPMKKKSSSQNSSSHSQSTHSSSSHSSSSSKSRNKEDAPKKHDKHSKREERSSSSNSSKNAAELLSPNTKLSPLPPLSVSVSALPEISPNYVPRPAPRLIDSIVPYISDEAALSVGMNSKNQRTKVFSGNRVIHGSIPSLYELCCYVLQENIDALEYTGGVPYYLLKPVIEKASPNQLFTLEHYNPYLIEKTGELWQQHCMKTFRMQKRQEMESWRDMFMRCTDEQEAKLRSLTANIKLAQDQSTPVRTTKMAYVDSIVKPPRNIARKQAIYGTAKKPAVSPAARVASLAGGNVVKGTEARGLGASSSGQGSRSTGFLKPKKAPLMQKALQLIKGRYKR